MKDSSGKIQCPRCDAALDYKIAEFNGKTYLALMGKTTVSKEEPPTFAHDFGEPPEYKGEKR